jgi:hypothetical protein
MLLVAVILVLVGHYVTEGMIKMLFFVLALVVAVVAVVRLTGIG